MPLILASEVATWARLDASAFGAFENMVIDKAQNLVADEAGHPEWVAADLATVPFRARMIALNLAKRTILNPDRVIQEGGVGPIGGDRLADDAALAMELSEAETRELRKFRGTGTAPSGLFLLPISDPTPSETTIFVADESGSDWLIPYATVGDIGEPDAYGTY